MINILSDPKTYSLETCIAHIIKRDPDFISLGDACPEAGGSQKIYSGVMLDGLKKLFFNSKVPKGINNTSYLK